MYRPSTKADCVYLADNLRVEDANEVAAGGVTPLLALLFGLRNSEICLTLIDPKTGLPGAMLGVGPTDRQGIGQIWLLGTPAIENNAVTFLRNSKRILKLLYDNTHYDAFFNFTHKANTLHHRWLRWLGFDFIRELKKLPTGEPHYEFIRYKDQ